MISLILSHEDVAKGSGIKFLIALGNFFFGIEILIGFTTMKINQGQKLTKLYDIGLNYLKGKFAIDLSCFLVLLIHNTLDIGSK